MTERRRSTVTRTSMALVDGVDKHGRRFGEYREVTLPAPFDEAHRQRGERLRRARIDAGRSLMGLHSIALAFGLPDDFTFATLSQVEHGTTEATEEEWAALYAALGVVEALEGDADPAAPIREDAVCGEGGC